MKESLKQESKLRQAKCEQRVEGQVEVAVFRQTSRRCTELNAKIKKQRGSNASSAENCTSKSPQKRKTQHFD